MDLLILALSRLVPLLFLVSLGLIGTRYVYDLNISRGRTRARLAASAVAAVALAAGLPIAVRGALILGARWAAGKAQWATQDALLSKYDAWNGRRTDEFLRQWAYARMNLGDWAGAESVLELNDHPSPQTSMLIGVCQYYQGLPQAPSTLAKVPDFTQTQLCIRDYFLGRISQKSGDLGRAFALYGRSAGWDPNFFPSVYHGVRLALMKGDTRLASNILGGFIRNSPGYISGRDVAVLTDSIRTRTVPPDKEFVIVAK